jgi:cyclic pyranopterin phosphate synthase
MRVRAAPKAARLSITDRCDLACVYCRPHRHDGYLPSERRMSPDDWARLAEGLVKKGVTRFRITGGEPLVHAHAVDIVRAIAALPGVEDVAMTTNGTRHEELAGPLRDAGLHRLNLSIDSLVPQRFSAMTRGGSLDTVLRGIAAAIAVGFRETKTNTVVVGRGDDESEPHNEDELPSIVRWAWSLDLTPRFLEVMTIGEGAKLRGRIVPYRTMVHSLGDLVCVAPPVRPHDRGPAGYLVAADGSGRKVGFITGSSDTFCEGCDRLRATSDGALRPCLATNDQVDVREAISRGDVDAIGRGLDDAWAIKPDGVTWKGCTEESAASVNMRATGG